MVCRLMPAARATSASVIADQSRLPSSSRIASSTESRRRARDASAYGTLRIRATLTPVAPILCNAALGMVALVAVTSGRLPPFRSPTSPRRSPGSSSLRGCRPSGCRARCRPPATPWPRRIRSRTARRRTVCSRSFPYLQNFEVGLFTYSAVRAAPVLGKVVPPGSRRGSVAGRHLLAQAWLPIAPGDVAAVVRQHPVVHQPAPQRREVGQPDQRRVTARRVRRPVHAAQRLVAPGRVGVVITVPLQVVQEQVGDDVVGIPAVLRRAALVPAVVVLEPQQAIVLEVVDRLQQAET